MGKFQLIEISKDLLKFSEEGNIKQIEEIARKFDKKEFKFFCDHPAFDNFGFNAIPPTYKKRSDNIILEDTIKYNDQNIKEELSINDLIKIYGGDFKLSNLPKGIRIRKEYKAKEFKEQNKESLKNIISIC